MHRKTFVGACTRGYHGSDFSGLGPAQSETKYKILAHARPDQFFPNFAPDHLGLTDFNFFA